MSYLLNQQSQPPQKPQRQPGDFFGNFKLVLAVGTAVIVLGFAGLIFAITQTQKPQETEKKDSPTTEGIKGGASTGDATAQPDVTEKVPGQSFEGKGKKAISFKAGGGLTLIKLSHRGPANFVVQYGKGPDASTLLVNEIGKYDGSKAVGLDEGDYTLNIDTTGDWAVEIDQRIPTTAEAPPQKLSGHGQSATKFFTLKAGSATFVLSHKGTALFSPFLLKSDGTAVTLLANAVGDFSGQKVVNISEEGIYLVDVSASGDWTIDVSQ